MKKSLSALGLVLLALGSIVSPAAAEESVVPSPSPSCAAESASNAALQGLQEWLDAAGCCPRTCNVNSDCDASCGPGFGECKFLGSCCSFCLCSPGGSFSALTVSDRR